MPTASFAALSWTLGLALTTPLLTLLGFLSLPISATSIVWLQVSLTFCLACVTPQSERRGAMRLRQPASVSHWIARAFLSLAILVFALKVLIVPLWSWDHYANWGLKARRLFADHALDVSFLQLRIFHTANPDHPIGFPTIVQILTLGSEPRAVTFKVIHLVSALALLLILREAILHVSDSFLVADGLALFVALTPLLWDTEQVGLADLPLALIGTAAMLLLVRSGESTRRALAAGGMIGFLPWIKKEGAALAALMTAAWLLRKLCLAAPLSRRRRTVELLAPVVALVGGAWAVERFALGPGLSFFAGDWLRRGLTRVREAPIISKALLEDLVRREWLGFWLAFALIVIAGIILRRFRALLLCSVVCGQVLVYAFVYLFTYLEPQAHIRSSFYRLLAALVPLAAIGLAAVLCEKPIPRSRGRGKIEFATCRRALTHEFRGSVIERCAPLFRHAVRRLERFRVGLRAPQGVVQPVHDRGVPETRVAGF